MKTRLNRDIKHLQILFIVIGVLFALTTALFLIANHESLLGSYGKFGSSLMNILSCLTPIVSGIISLIYLIPMVAGVLNEKISARMFEFLVLFSRISMYFMAAPFIAVVAMFVFFIFAIDQSYLFPRSLDMEGICAYLFYLSFIPEAVFVLVAYHHSHRIGVKR